MIGHIGGRPTITNLVLVSHLLEYSYQFSSDLKKLLVQPRNFKDLHFSFKPGETNTNYLSLYSGSPYYEDNVIGPVTMYFRAAEDNVVVEIIEWTGRD